MNKDVLIGVAVGLAIGVVGTLGFTATKDKKPQTANTQVVTSTTDHNATTTNNLKNLKGNDFDKAFIEEMIMHHQGAIDMAKLIPERAKHEEIKALGEAIISAQTKEIQDMQQWQKDWGYTSSSNEHMTH